MQTNQCTQQGAVWAHLEETLRPSEEQRWLCPLWIHPERHHLWLLLQIKAHDSLVRPTNSFVFCSSGWKGMCGPVEIQPNISHSLEEYSKNQAPHLYEVTACPTSAEAVTLTSGKIKGFNV